MTNYSRKMCTCAMLSFAAIAGCNRKTPTRTRADIAADSALAADLALANRDTMLLDSIGGKNPDTIPPDSTLAGSLEGKPRVVAAGPTAPPPSAPSTPARIAPATKPPTAPSVSSVVVPPPAPAPTPTAPRAAPRQSSRTVTPRATTRTHSSNPCNSPAQADQEACVRTKLASTDLRMNRVYRALITQMRLQEGVKPGQKDPASVARLRTAQRAWLVYRDTECRRLGKGKEGPLWAPSRAQCLGEFSEKRANELADNFSRLTAH